MDKEFFNDIDNMVKVHELKNENKKLRQTLQEIKEMCEKHLSAERIVMAQEIIDKIDEVQND